MSEIKLNPYPFSYYQFDDELCLGIACEECAFHKKDDYGNSQCLLSLRLEEHGYNTAHAHNESETGFLCSACRFGDFGLFNHGGKYAPKYCPNCGAKMDEVSG